MSWPVIKIVGVPTGTKGLQALSTSQLSVSWIDPSEILVAEMEAAGRAG
jgi:hypothetical protein